MLNQLKTIADLPCSRMACVQFEVQLQNVDARLSEDPERPTFRVLLHDRHRGLRADHLLRQRR